MQCSGRILVVEDNPITRRLYRAVFQGEGFEVDEASSSAEALARIATSRPDVILQDIVLDDVDGCVLAQRIRRLEGCAELLIIAVSGSSDPYTATGKHGPFDEWITKPVEPSRLVALLRDRLAHADRTPDRARVLLVDDDPLQLKAARARLQLFGYSVATACGGREALARAVDDVPDVIASDVVMPDMSGFDLCRAIRADDQFGRVPVVLMTNHHLEPADASTAAGVGANALVGRTPDLTGVVAAIEAALTAGGPPAVNVDHAENEHLGVLSRLERQSAGAEELRRAVTRWKSTLSFLENLSDFSAPPGDPDQVLGDILGSYLDVFGMPFGAAYAADDSGRLVLKATIGFPARTCERLADFFGRGDVLAEVLARRTPRLLRSDDARPDGVAELLSACGAGVAILTPLVAFGSGLGVLVVASPRVRVPVEWEELMEATSAPAAHTLRLARSVRRLVNSEHRFRGIAESTDEGILVTDTEGVILYANPAAVGLLGARAAVGGRVIELMPFLDGRLSEQRGHGTAGDGHAIPIEVSISEFEDEPGQARRAYVFRDLTERLKLEHYSFLAERDPLTGLANRRRFLEILLDRLAEARRYGTCGSLLMMDLDGFKEVNDALGHAAGDLVLNQVSEVFLATLRESDLAARLGGDEFAVLLPQETLEGAERCAERLLENLARAGLRGIGRPIRGSIGIACYPADASTPEALLDCADRALYRAKRAGGSRSETHDGSPQKGES